MKNELTLILLSIFIISSISALNADSNTVALWNLDEGSGVNIVDSTGNGNNGILNGGTIWTNNSVSGFALWFDGVNDYVSITKTSFLDVLNEVTLEASIKRTSYTDGMIFSRNGPYYLAVRNNTISGGVFAGSWWEELSGNTFLEQGVWYDLKLTYDGENLDLYVNDILDASVPKTGQMIPWSQQGYIGYGEPGHNQYFTGIIDEVRISNIARTNQTQEPPQQDLESRVEQLENKVEELETKVTLLEEVTEKILSYFGFMSVSIKKRILCSELKESEETQIENFGLKCKIKLRRNREICSCKKSK